MATMDVLENLRTEFSQHLTFRERRPGIFQVVAPLFHEDGDMVDMFIDLPRTSSDPVRISDHGMTLMRLSYSYEIDTPTKQRIFERIISENGVSETNGRLYIETTPERIYPVLLQFAQTVAKVSNMQAFKREVVQSLFYEMLNEFVVSSLSSYRPNRHYQPLPNREDLDVDWRFPLKTRDIYLYGVKDGFKARLVGLSCLEFQKERVPFRSVLVYEDENCLSKKDLRRITNIADKQFATLPDFLREAEPYFAREARVEPTNPARVH